MQIYCADEWIAILECYNLLILNAFSIIHMIPNMFLSLELTNNLVNFCITVMSSYFWPDCIFNSLGLKTNCKEFWVAKVGGPWSYLMGLFKWHSPIQTTSHSRAIMMWHKKVQLESLDFCNKLTSILFWYLQISPFNKLRKFSYYMSTIYNYNHLGSKFKCPQISSLN